LGVRCLLLRSKKVKAVTINRGYSLRRQNFKGIDELKKDAPPQQIESQNVGIGIQGHKDYIDLEVAPDTERPLNAETKRTNSIFVSAGEIKENVNKIKEDIGDFAL